MLTPSRLFSYRDADRNVDFYDDVIVIWHCVNMRSPSVLYVSLSSVFVIFLPVNILFLSFKLCTTPMMTKSG